MNFIGEFAVPELPVDPEVLAAQEQERLEKLERQERRHQQYLKRKASGKQQEYDRRYNEKRRAKREAEKAAALPMAVNQ